MKFERIAQVKEAARAKTRIPVGVLFVLVRVISWIGSLSPWEWVGVRAYAIPPHQHTMCRDRSSLAVTKRGLFTTGLLD